MKVSCRVSSSFQGYGSHSLFFYKMAANVLYSKSENLRIVWQSYLGLELEQDVWDNIVHNMGWAVRDIKTRFIYYKIIHKYNWTN